jgi:hypothetical protein
MAVTATFEVKQKKELDMAKKISPPSRKIETPAAKATVSTPVRNSAIPKASASPAAKAEITRDQIAKRAYEIHLSGGGGSETDNWHRAERELRGGR